AAKGTGRRRSGRGGAWDVPSVGEAPAGSVATGALGQATARVWGVVGRTTPACRHTALVPPGECGDRRRAGARLLLASQRRVRPAAWRGASGAPAVRGRGPVPRSPAGADLSFPDRGARPGVPPRQSSSAAAALGGHRPAWRGAIHSCRSTGGAGVRVAGAHP